MVATADLQIVEAQCLLMLSSAIALIDMHGRCCNMHLGARAGQGRAGQGRAAQHITAQHSTAEHSTAQHSTAHHCTAHDMT